MNANIQDCACNQHQSDHQDPTQQDGSNIQPTDGSDPLLPNSSMSMPMMGVSNYDLLSFALTQSGLTTSFNQHQFQYPQYHHDGSNNANNYHQLTYQHDTDVQYRFDADGHNYLDGMNAAIRLQADQTSQDYQPTHDNYHGHLMQPSSLTGTITPDSANGDTSLVANVALPPLPLGATEFVQNLTKATYPQYPLYTR